MTLDDQLREYFGTDDLATLSPAALEAGRERLLVDFGLEKDSGRRFALWLLLHTLGAAPDLDIAFESAADRDLARDFIEMTERDS
jgi:hypothetical protein